MEHEITSEPYARSCVPPAPDERPRTALEPEQPEQPELPLDEPVPYRLTTRARRLVATSELPALQVVGGVGRNAPVDLDGTDDTSRVRARALHRAGGSIADIAEELSADPLHVTAWVEDLPVRATGRLRVVAGTAAAPEPRRGAPGATSARPDDAGGVAAATGGWDRHESEAFAEAAVALSGDPGLRAGLGLLGGLVRTDRHAVLLDTDDLPLLAAGWEWLRTTFDVPTSGTRVLVSHATADAGDRLAGRVATALALPLGAVATTRVASCVPGAPRLRLRHADPALAARLAGWRRYLLAELTHHPSSRVAVGRGPDGRR